MSAARAKLGEYVKGKVFKIAQYGAFVRLANGQKGLIHISQASDDYVDKISDCFQLGQEVNARIIKIDGDRIDLSLKTPPQTSVTTPQEGFRFSVFEDKLDNFLHGNPQA